MPRSPVAPFPLPQLRRRWRCSASHAGIATQVVPLLRKRRDAIDDLLAILLLNAEPNFLAGCQPVELMRIGRPDLKTALLHEDAALTAIHDQDLADDFLWRQDSAARRHGRGKRRPASHPKHAESQRPDHVHSLP